MSETSERQREAALRADACDPTESDREYFERRKRELASKRACVHGINEHRVCLACPVWRRIWQ